MSWLSRLLGGGEENLGCCGGTGGQHLKGCPLGGIGPELKGRARGADGRPHKHSYAIVRSEKAIVRDRRKRWEVTYWFLECAEPNCPQPDKVMPTRRLLS